VVGSVVRTVVSGVVGRVVRTVGGAVVGPTVGRGGRDAGDRRVIG
jgi:hypothetical protein